MSEAEEAILRKHQPTELHGGEAMRLFATIDALRAQLEQCQRERDAERTTRRRLQEAYLPGNWERLQEIVTERDSLAEAAEGLAIEARDLVYLLKTHVQPLYNEDSVLGLEISERLRFASEALAEWEKRK